MRCVVTGAGGFIGSSLARRLLEDGAEVTGVDALLDNYDPGMKRENLARLTGLPGFEVCEAPLQDLDLESLFVGRDCVFHLAALPGVRSSWGDTFAEYAAHNVHATQVVLEAALRAAVPRVVYASSSSVYGDSRELPMRESAREMPYSPYGVTKLAGEHLARLYHRNYELSTVSLRYFTVYGPRQRPDMAIQRFLAAAGQGRPITVFGDGEQTRDFTYVDDVVEATVRAARLGRPGAIYNVGGGSTVTVNELIALIERVTGRQIDVQRVGKQQGDVLHTRADTARARADLEFVPATPLAVGLRSQWESLDASVPLPESDPA